MAPTRPNAEEITEFSICGKEEEKILISTETMAEKTLCFIGAVVGGVAEGGSSSLGVSA